MNTNLSFYFSQYGDDIDCCIMTNNGYFYVEGDCVGNYDYFGSDIFNNLIEQLKKYNNEDEKFNFIIRYLKNFNPDSNVDIYISHYYGE